MVAERCEGLESKSEQMKLLDETDGSLMDHSFMDELINSWMGGWANRCVGKRLLLALLPLVTLPPG